MEIIYFAELDETSKVVNVIASGEVYNSIEDEINLLKTAFGHERWVQTWRDGKERRQFAAITGAYDKENDVFIDPKPAGMESFVLVNGRWYPPTPAPDRYIEENWPVEHGEYTDAHQFYWDEESLSWKLFIFRPEQNDI